MTREQLFDNICRKQSFLCVGLDTDLKKVPQHLIERAAQDKDFDPIFEFNSAIIDATAPYCIAYKPNLAFYEAHGVKGWMAFERTVEYIRNHYPDQFIIADAKRGDIGNTSKLYARTFFEEMDVDAVTVAPYMGEDSVTPFLGYDGKWVILLALTSNKGSQDFQKTIIQPQTPSPLPLKGESGLYLSGCSLILRRQEVSNPFLAAKNHSFIELRWLTCFWLVTTLTLEGERGGGLGLYDGLLEILTTLIACQCQEDHPLAIIAEERRDAVFAHVGGYGHGVDVHLFKKGTRVELGCVTDVVALCVSDDELVGVVFADVLHRLLEGYPAFHTMCLVEGEVGLVGDAVGCRCVDDGLVEFEDGVESLFLRSPLEEELRHFLQIRVESYAKEALLKKDILVKLFTCHVFKHQIRKPLSSLPSLC